MVVPDSCSACYSTIIDINCMPITYLNYVIIWVQWQRHGFYDTLLYWLQYFAARSAIQWGTDRLLRALSHLSTGSMTCRPVFPFDCIVGSETLFTSILSIIYDCDIYEHVVCYVFSIRFGVNFVFFPVEIFYGIMLSSFIIVSKNPKIRLNYK